MMYAATVMARNVRLGRRVQRAKTLVNDVSTTIRMIEAVEGRVAPSDGNVTTSPAPRIGIQGRIAAKTAGMSRYVNRSSLLNKPPSCRRPNESRLVGMKR